jgi:hypothetical protein
MEDRRTGFGCFQSLRGDLIGSHRQIRRHGRGMNRARDSTRDDSFIGQDASPLSIGELDAQYVF